MSTRRHSSRRARVLAALLLVATTAIIAACSSAAKSSSSTSSNSPSSTLSEGLSFYKGKTLTIIVSAAAGSSQDIWVRAFAAPLGKYLGASIRVSDVSGANGIVGANELGNADSDGLTIGLVNLSTALETMVTKGSSDPTASGLSYDWTKLAWLTAKPAASDALVVRSSTPYKTFADLQSASNKISVLEVTSGVGALYTNMVVQGYGLNSKTITGYTGTSQLIAGVLRGDGDLIVSQISGALGGAIREGQLRALALTSPDSPSDPTYPYVKSVPTFAQILAEDPPANSTDARMFSDALNFITLVNGLAAPIGTPSSRVDALVSAIKAVYAEPAVQKELEENGIPTNYVTPQAVSTFVTNGYRNGVDLKDWLS